MNFFLKSPTKHITVLTGGHLDLTKKLASLMRKSNNDEILITYKDFDIAQEKFYQEHENLRVFKCDLGKAAEMDDLLHYLTKFKIRNMVYCDHFIGTFNPLIKTEYNEIREMTKRNIEIPMILNSKLVKNNNFEKNAKVLQFLFPLSDNLKNIANFNTHKMVTESFKHMILCLREDLSKNPVFFSLCKIRYFENVYLDILNQKNLLDDETKSTLYSKDAAASFIEYLLSNKVDPYKFGSTAWDIHDAAHQENWVNDINNLLYFSNNI